MSRGTDWKQARALVRERLEPGEKVEAIFNAAVPGEDTGRGFAAVWAWPIIMAVQHGMRRAAVQQASQAAWVQLAPKMIIALTPRRLIIGRADRRWRRLEEITGDLPLAQIKDLKLGAASSTTRRVTLTLTNGESVMLRMPRQAADHLRDRLS